LLKALFKNCKQRTADKSAQASDDLKAIVLADSEVDVADNWPQALAIHTSPGSLPSAIGQVSQLVDDIWYAAGDKSADFNWYTKRALLAGKLIQSSYITSK